MRIWGPGHHLAISIWKAYTRMAMEMLKELLALRTILTGLLSVVLIQIRRMRKMTLILRGLTRMRMTFLLMDKHNNLQVLITVTGHGRIPTIGLKMT
jgi:hypothetical protein